MATPSKLAPYVWPQVDANGNPYSGALLYTYLNNTTTPAATYTSPAGTTANANPIVFSSLGEPSNGTNIVEVCIPNTITYTFVLKTSGGATIGTWNDLRGINDFDPANIAQWYTPNPVIVPTRLSNTSFSIPTANAEFEVGRRVKIYNGTAYFYGTIGSNSGGSPSTIVCSDMSPVLSGTLTTAEYGILTSTNPAVPKVLLPNGTTATTQATGTSDTQVATTAFVTTASYATLNNGVNDFRLTLTSNTPVTSSDVTGASGNTLYLTPYTGNAIGMYSGSVWSLVTSAEVSLALAGVTTSTTLPYDIFVVNTAGTLSLEAQVWASANARANALPYQNGVLVKYGDATRRYVGTVAPAVAATPTSGRLEDSVANRGVWNYYNRVNRNMKYIIALASWTYNVVAWRTCNALTTYRLSFVCGLLEDSVSLNAVLTSGNATGNNGTLGIGFNSVTTPTSLTASSGSTALAGANTATVSIDEIPVLGVNYAQMLEYCNSANTTTFYGTSGGYLSGITGTIKS